MDDSHGDFKTIIVGAQRKTKDYEKLCGEDCLMLNLLPVIYSKTVKQSSD